MDELGARIRQLREKQGLGVREVARAAGIDPGQLSRLEHGQAKRPGHSTLTNLAAALQVTPAELTGIAEPALLTAGADFAAAHRWARLVGSLLDVDMEAHLHTLTELSPPARAHIMAYAQWRLQQEQATGERIAQNSVSKPRILGGEQ